MDMMDDEEYAKLLQEEEYKYNREAAVEVQAHHHQASVHESDLRVVTKSGGQRQKNFENPEGLSPVDPSLEFSDPNPDIRELFLQFNAQFFWDALSGIEVKWSPRMTLCAGLCVYEGRGGLCSVRLSLPLLKLRSRKDLIETLLHEMIHAYLFVTDNDRDHDGHGPHFHKHMYRINKLTGANISVYHTFHDEVASYQQHWWRCNGPCQNRKPYFGYVKRAMNRAPSARDFWWATHQATCGGIYTKIKEPADYGQKKNKKKEEQNGKTPHPGADIRAFAGKGQKLGVSSTSSKIDRRTTTFTSTSNSSSTAVSKNTDLVQKTISPLFASINNVMTSSKESDETCDKQSNSVQKPGLKDFKINSDNKSGHPFQNHSRFSSGKNIPESYKKWKRKDFHDSTQSNKKHIFPKNFVSVCEDAFSKRGKHISDFKKKRVKKNYVLDELDSNNGLWDSDDSSNAKKMDDSSAFDLSLEEHGIEIISTLCIDKKTSETSSWKAPTSSDNSKLEVNNQHWETKGHLSSDLKGNSFNSSGSFKLGSGGEGSTYLAKIRKELSKQRSPSNQRKKSDYFSRQDSNEKQKWTREDSVYTEHKLGNKRSSHEAFRGERLVGEVSGTLNKRKKTETIYAETSQIEDSDSSDDSVFVPTSQNTGPSNSNSNNELVPCPVCGSQVPEVSINTHLDSCLSM